ncbi:chitinase 2-like [Phoenix dactylifera]|uniref:Chitinase 2-like n=1 Tax=Phoenix dactylifera TaxID=42345 RepID=A0A8B7BGW9_PHODC|nr:chitinase 2-like [Phoenix dactylifera]
MPHAPMAPWNNPSFLFLLALLSLMSSASQSSRLFREYIGAESNCLSFLDVPIHPSVDFHFILSFAVDYTTSKHPTPTNGDFNIFWDDDNLTPSHVTSIKQSHGNVKVAFSLGGDSLGPGYVYFHPFSIDSWVANAVTSLSRIIKRYNLDGIDIDYEHFMADPDTFAECIGRLLTTLKNNRVISFASIAPFEDDEVQRHYLALWRKYGSVIDYVNFQFYAYDASTTVSQFLGYFEMQRSNYNGGKILVSCTTDRSSSGGLSPEHGFFNASRMLKMQGKLDGIFIWSADDSKSNGFLYEKQSQDLLASDRLY